MPINNWGKSAVDATRKNALPPYLDSTISAVDNAIGVSRIELSAEVDFNNIKTTGVYYTSLNTTAQTFVNCPSSHAGILTVYNPLRNVNIGTDCEITISGSNTYITQKWETYDGYSYKRYIVWSNTNQRWTYYDWFIEGQYRVNDVIITSNGTNPGNTYGGTWELIDKEFSTTAWTSREVTLNTTNCDSCTVYSLHHGHTIELEIQPETKVALADTNVTIATFTPANFGLSGWGREQWFTTFTDTGNGLVNWSLTDAGTFRSIDAWQLKTNPEQSVPAQIFSKFNIIVNVPMSVMLDTWCNKFYWKRTA